jgi:hypothetical protein
MKTRHVESIAAVTLLAMLVAGCESLPVRYSSEELARVGNELSDADSINAELGNADLVRENGRLWIYTWAVLLPYVSRSILVLEFDTDGRLLNKELSLAARPTRSEPDRDLPNYQYCTAGGTCIEHAIHSDAGFNFDGTFSAVTVKGAAKERIRPTEKQADECVLVIWPGEAWSESRSSLIMAPYGMALSVEGAPRWALFRWVPSGAFARMVLPAGDHVLSVRDPVWDERMADQDSPPGDFGLMMLDLLLSPPLEKSDLPPSSAPFHCASGDEVYLKVDAAFVERSGVHWFPIVLRSMEAAEAQALMADMAQVLPSDY